MKRFLLVLVFMFSLIASTYADWDLRDKIVKDDGGEGADCFGHSVDIDGDYAIVSAYMDENDDDPDYEYNFGAVYIYKKAGDNWVQQGGKIVAPDRADGDVFGCSVAIDGDYAIIGAQGVDEWSGGLRYDKVGAAYVFKKGADGAWAYQAKLEATDVAVESRYFGYSVDIDGDYAVVGAYYDSNRKGAAYIFKRNGAAWNAIAKLTADDGDAADWFGCSVAIDGNNAVIGAEYADGISVSGTGAAYVYRLENGVWTQKQKLLSHWDHRTSFGCSVSLDGDYALIGAKSEYVGGQYAGAAFVFKWDGNLWEEENRFYADDGYGTDYFGGSVSLYGDYALIGAVGDDDVAPETGSAYLFKRDGRIWVQQQKFIANDPVAHDDFGCSVAIYGDDIFIGAERVENVNNDDVGAAYIYFDNVVDITWDGSESTDWNTAANWDLNVVPTTNHNVLIPAGLVNYPEISINDNAVSVDLTVNGGAELTILSGGSFIPTGTITNNGTIEIKRTIPNNEWHHISSPVSNATAEVFAGEFLLNWTEATESWNDIDVANFNLEVGKGYSLWGDAKGVYTFSGSPRTESVTVIMTNNGGNGDAEGFNLLGNPFTSSLDWNQFDYGTIYYWDGAQQQYAKWNSWSGGTNGGTQFIPPMQGFFVEAPLNAGYELRIPYTARIHTDANTFWKEETNDQRIRLTASSANGMKDETLLVFNDAAIAGFEHATDARKLFSGTEGMPELYSIENEKRLSIDMRPLVPEIQLGFYNDQSGTYSIAANEISKLENATLEDTKFDVLHKLADGAYTFEWEAGEDEKRFKLHLGTTSINDVELSAIQVYPFGEEIVIKSVIPASEITLTDISGRVLGEWQNLGSIPAPITAGIYLVTINTNNQKVTKKILIK